MVKAQERPDEIVYDRPDVGLADFVEATVNFKLHEWQQKYLCPLLERLKDERGLRLAIHGPPQYGKSVITSQRTPAYLIGYDPKVRIGLACYNETHAGAFGEVVKGTLVSEEFRQMFPDPACRVAANAPAKRFRTQARKDQRDGQYSFLALGLNSGFTGKGLDNLFIDDPYKSADDARSAAINEKVWRWWSQTAGPRIPDTSNVIVMFHRYHDDDLAGRLLNEGGWEYVRFPAIADANEDGSDPTGRAPGMLLSPMRSREWLEKQREKDSITFLGQFQGTPRPDEGGFFKVDKLVYVDALEVPKGIRCVRAWDLAATEGAGDWTVGVLIGTTGDGTYWILDVVRGRWATDKRNETILRTAKMDGRNVRIRGPQDPGSAGVDAAKAFVKLLAGYSVRTERVSGSKATRADPFSSQLNAGNVKIVRAPWNAAYVNELRNFLPDNDAGIDDQVDAGSDSFNELHRGRDFAAASGGEMDQLTFQPR